MQSNNYPYGNSYLLIRLVPGLVFLSEGIQKFLVPAEVGPGRFEKIGFPHPEFWAYFTACFEITCGLLLIIGLIVRWAVIPLLIVMIVAFITTKIPIFNEKGFWTMAHEYRTDFAMTVLLIFLLMNGSGRLSVDSWIARNKGKPNF